MRALTALLVGPAVTLAAAIIPRAYPLPGPWTAGVWRVPAEGDAYFLGEGINANGGKFYVNKNTSSYCPPNVPNLNCSAFPGTRTVFTGGNNTLFLDVAVPGGQQVYIAKDGSLSYTIPHSGALPEGAVTTGFERSISLSGGAPVVLSHSGQFWLMCPVSEGEPRERTYQIYVGHGTQNCLNTGVRTYTASGGPDAWEYL
ncbi:hypothetical protein F4811DRAFT_567063 [Daldinia bambusicola]|nr:hypothetical protein F4811DRAFT_567063 [Daldinia bambusicola]